MKEKTKKISEKDLLERVSEYLESNTGGAIVAKILLAVLAGGGLVFAGAVAPNLIRAVEQTRRFGSGKRSLKEKSMRSTFSRLKKDGLVVLKETSEGVVTIFLSEKGRRYVYDFTHVPKIKKPLIWDRKWRVVVFDIVTKKRREHEIFRRQIKKMGFLQLQKSVWVFPYRCEDEILFLAKQLGIVEYIEIFTAQKMIHKKELEKTFFHLSEKVRSGTISAKERKKPV